MALPLNQICEYTALFYLQRNLYTKSLVLHYLLFLIGCLLRANTVLCHKILLHHLSLHSRRFDASLKARDTSWGVRDLEEVAKVAAKNSLKLHVRVEMPANNLSVIYTKTSTA